MVWPCAMVSCFVVRIFYAIKVIEMCVCMRGCVKAHQMDFIGSAVFCRCSAAGQVHCFRHVGSTLEKASWHIHAKIHFHQPKGARGFPGSALQLSA